MLVEGGDQLKVVSARLHIRHAARSQLDRGARAIEDELLIASDHSSVLVQPEYQLLLLVRMAVLELLQINRLADIDLTHSRCWGWVVTKFLK